MESLDNNHYISSVETKKQEKQKIKEQKEQEQKDKKMERDQKKMERDEKKLNSDQKKHDKQEKKTSIMDIDDNIDFMNMNSKDDESLDVKIQRSRAFKKLLRYKESFRDELEHIKINQKDSLEKINDSISLCQETLESTWVENTISDCIFQLLENIEPLSSKTKFDISGLSKVLQKDQKVKNLILQIGLKYGSICQISAEWTLLMSICASTYLVIVANGQAKIGIKNQEELNKSRESIHTFLNKKI